MAFADSEIAGVHPYERSNSPGQDLAVCGNSASFEDGNGYRSKVIVKWPTNRATCFETLLQNELNCDVHVVPPSFKPVLQRIRLRQVALTLTSDWIKLCGSYVACCKTSLPWAGKTRNLSDFENAEMIVVVNAIYAIV